MSRVVSALAAPAAGSVPVVWDFLGYHVPAGPLVVGLCAVAITRLIVYLNTNGRRQVLLDIAVTGLCGLLTAIWIQSHDLDLLTAGLSGLGIASVGIGVISVAKGTMEGRLRAAFQAFLGIPPKA